VRLFFFTDEQRGEIEAHLSSALPADDIAWSVCSLDRACAFAGLSAAAKAAMQAYYRHYNDIRKHAYALRVLLVDLPPMPMPDGDELDWVALDRQLEQLERSATFGTLGTGIRPAGRRRRGRPPFEWRDDLIAVAFNTYPPGMAINSADSHFETTITMLFGFLSHSVEDVHSVIADALRRRPVPPLFSFPEDQPA
jgi:hypothetical protein